MLLTLIDRIYSEACAEQIGHGNVPQINDMKLKYSLITNPKYSGLIFCAVTWKNVQIGLPHFILGNGSTSGLATGCG
jgi:hypothetical protein